MFLGDKLSPRVISKSDRGESEHHCNNSKSKPSSSSNTKRTNFPLKQKIFFKLLPLTGESKPLHMVRNALYWK